MKILLYLKNQDIRKENKMKINKNIESTLKELGLVDQLILSVSRFLKVDKDTAKKIVEMRMEKVFNRIGNGIINEQIKIKEGNLDQNIKDMSIDEILNSDNIIKEK